MNATSPDPNGTAGSLQRVAIFGAGVSGQSALRLTEAMGHSVCLFDQGVGDAALESDVASAFTAECLDAFDLFVFSPGFAAGHPWRLLVENSGKPCYSELGYAATHWRGKLLGITGTNGKTTLTKLLCAALLQSGRPAYAVGNIGRPLSDLILTADNDAAAYAVCEISSFQAELPRGLELDGLAWTNFAEDHLDRYASMAEYYAAKAHLFDTLKPDAPCIVGPGVVAFGGDTVPATSDLIANDMGLLETLSPDSPFQNHPQSDNLAMAAALWIELGFPLDTLLDSANDFKLAPHRLAEIEEWGGVRFWDDSKATNFHAALAAIKAMEAPVFWIGGGHPKGGDLAAFTDALAPTVQAAFLYGEAAELLAEHLRPIHPWVEIHPRFQDAVEAAAKAALASPPADVLLSPGFASFDQFENYSERGKSFISTVLSLKDVMQAN